MSKEFLNRADVFTVFEQVCGKAMSKCMAADFLMNSGSADGALQSFLYRTFMAMMSSFGAMGFAWIETQTGCWKQVLPL